MASSASIYPAQSSIQKCLRYLLRSFGTLVNLALVTLGVTIFFFDETITGFYTFCQWIARALGYAVMGFAGGVFETWMGPTTVAICIATVFFYFLAGCCFMNEYDIIDVTKWTSGCSVCGAVSWGVAVARLLMTCTADSWFFFTDEETVALLEADNAQRYQPPPGGWNAFTKFAPPILEEKSQV